MFQENAVESIAASFIKSINQEQMRILSDYR